MTCDRGVRGRWARWLLPIGVASVCLAAIGAAWQAGNLRARALDHRMRDGLIQRALGAAGGLNPRLMARLTFSAADRGTPVDLRVRADLASVAARSSVRGIYTVQQRAGRYYFGPETYPSGDPLSSAPGDEYRQPPPELARVFADQRARAVGPYTDEYGRFVSVLAPVAAPGGGVTAVVGLDVMATDWASQLAAEQRRPLLAAGGLLAALLLLSAVVVWRFLRLGTSRPQLRHWVVAPTLAAVLVALTAYGTSRYGQFSTDARADLSRFMEHAGDVWARGIANRTLLLRAHADYIIQDETLMAAWALHDMRSLSSRSTAILDRLRPEYGVTHLTVFDPSGVALWRAHEPWHRGDRVNRPALLAARATKEDAWGVEPGALGAITLRYVRPCSRGGRLLGYVEVGMQLDRALDRLAKDLQSELFIAIRKQRLTTSDLTDVRQALGSGRVWHDFRDFGIIGPKGLPVPRQVTAWYSAPHALTAQMPGMQTDAGGRVLTCGAIPAHDGAGHDVADIIVVHDVTDDASAARAGLVAGFAMAVLLFGAVLHLLWSVTGQAEDRLDAVIADLTASEGRIRAITTSAQDAILMMDDRGRISYWNPAAERIFGYTAQEVVGKDLHALLAPERFRPAAEAAYGPFLQSGQGAAVGQVLDLAALRKDGVEISVRLSLSAVQMDGRWHAVGILSDITERIESERKIVEANAQLAVARDEANALAERANDASRAKSEFLASMSHEIRTPMNGIIGMTGLLLDTELTADQRQFAQIVRSSGDSLLALINDILDFSKIEAGKLDLEPLDFDLRTAMEDAVEVVALKAQQKGLDIVCMVDADLPEMVRGDAGRLRQIAVNLCSNAVKFTGAGSVALRASKEAETEASLTIRFTVTDTGIGIPADKQAQIFGAFSQADQSTTRKYGGTGLGLAISKQLAELMGGAIGVDSIVGAGSTFWFTAVLGRAAVRADQGPDGAAGGSALQGVRVLVVDDNEVNRLLISTLLETWGCDHAQAEDGAGALRMLREALEARRPFRLAILDMHMPGIDGEELAAAIAADHDLRSTLLMMLTSLSERGAAQRLAGHGVSRCLTKPVRQAALRACILEVLEMGRPGAASRAAGPDETDREAAARLSGRVLVAEDNPTNQLVALMILRKLGLRADAVANGVEALAAMRTTPYDIVLMDCQMPEMDGFEAARRVRDASSNVLDQSVPIIAMTAGAMRGDRDACLQAGMNDYITKPVRPADLAEVLGRWLTRRGDGAESAR
ncbi:MAG: response regulator [Armatimonadetes bacterium]|nr:response regulator [Armatimonadota bacterium]